MANTKSRKAPGKLSKVLRAFNPRSFRGGMALFALVFALTGGGYMLYRSFAYTSNGKIIFAKGLKGTINTIYGDGSFPQTIYTHNNSSISSADIIDNGTIGKPINNSSKFVVLGYDSMRIYGANGALIKTVSTTYKGGGGHFNSLRDVEYYDTGTGVKAVAAAIESGPGSYSQVIVVGEDGVITKITNNSDSSGLKSFSGTNWSGDGKKVFYERRIQADNGSQSSNIYVYNLQTKVGKILVSDVNIKYDSFDVSDDGNKIAYVIGNGNRDLDRLIVMNSDGTGSKTVLNGGFTKGFAPIRLNYNGTNVALGTEHISDTTPTTWSEKIEIINTSTGNRRIITTEKVVGGLNTSIDDIRWSPLEDKLAYSVQDDNKKMSYLYSINIQNSSKLKLASISNTSSNDHIYLDW